WRRSGRRARGGREGPALQPAAAKLADQAAARMKEYRPLERLNAALAGRYAIERELGSGGMATVYLADDMKHHRQDAVKVLRPELASAIGPDRFLREIEIAAKRSEERRVGKGGENRVYQC